MGMSIGLIELGSIARGIETSDAMLKAGKVELDFAKPVCPGKFIVMIHGEVGAIQASLKAGLAAGAGSVVNHLVIPRVHKTLLPAVNAAVEAPDLSALGVVEYFDISSAVVGADAAAKSAQVSLVEVRLGMGIGGKSFFKVCGQVSDVRNAVKEATEIAKNSGVIVSSCVIPKPAPALFREML
jgi:microcompartment protein CcmL/EutN